MSCADIFLALIAIIFPPLAVWVKSGICSADSLINIALCCLGFIPGLLHAWYIISKYPEYDYYDEYEPIRDAEAGRGRGQGQDGQGHVTYYYVAQQPGGGGSPQPQQPQPQQQNYGTQQQQQSSEGGGGEGASNGQTRAPPTYAEAVRGDNKVQSQT